MTVILSIIIVVAAISLADYYGSRSWQQVTSTVRNNTVFEHRNKKYGAFAIRRDYDKNLMLIILALVFSTGVGYAAFVGFKPVPSTGIFTPPDVDIIEPPIIAPKDVKPEAEVIKEIKPAASVETVIFITPVIVDKPILDKVKTQEELENERAAAEKAKQIGTGFTPVQVIKKDTAIYTKPEGPVIPDVEASYPGGFPKMMGFIQENFRVPDIGMEIKGKCYLKFIVDEDGIISSVKVQRGIPGCPECDREAIRILKSMPKWTPGSIKGRPVSSYFNLPIAFDVQ